MKLFCLAMLCCMLTVFSPNLARGESAALRIVSFSVEKTDSKPTDTLLVLSRIQINNIAVVRDQLRDGAHMVLKAVVSLHRLRSVLSNQLLGEKVVELHLRHDPLRRNFIVYFDKNIFQNRSLNDALQSAWDEIHFDLVPEIPLEAAQNYRVTMQLTLQHAEVPPWLEKALFFWSWDVVPPLTVTQDFAF